MKIKIATDEDKEIWDNIVSSSSHGTIFHTWKWLKIMERYSSNRALKMNFKNILYPLIVIKGSEIIGLMPIYYSKSPLIKTVYSPPIYGIPLLYLGPILSKYHIFNNRKRQSVWIQFQKEINKFIKNELNANLISIYSSPGLQDCRPFRWDGYDVKPRYTYIINLKNGTENIWKGFRKSLRLDILKAENEGIKIEDGSKRELEYIYDLLKKRQRIHSTKEYLIDIFNEFYPKNLKIFIAKKGDEHLSGIITTCYKNKVSFWVGSPKFSYKGISPNELVLWKSIKWAYDNGFEFYEIMGADDLSLYPFKSKFNGELIMYFYIEWSSPVLRLINAIYKSIKL